MLWFSSIMGVDSPTCSVQPCGRGGAEIGTNGVDITLWGIWEAKLCVVSITGREIALSDVENA